MKKYYKRIKKQLTELEKFVPVVVRVHGSEHPEFLLVKEQFDNLVIIVKDNKRDLKELEDIFLNLSKITTNYAIPSDVCQTYIASYNGLKKIEEIYNEIK